MGRPLGQARIGPEHQQALLDAAYKDELWRASYGIKLVQRRSHQAA
jgi:hypothetical protein